MYWDPTYVIIIPAVILTLIVNAILKTTYQKYSMVRSFGGVNAADVARKILDENGLYNVQIEYVDGELSDHYDPRNNKIRLSNSVYNSDSVAAIGIAAHEVGHAIQHAEGYFPIQLRNAILPVANIGSMAAMPLVLLGIVFWQLLVTFGIMLYTALVVFQLVTLPIEFNASSRAITTIESMAILLPEQAKGAKKVLNAAAMTYVAALAASLLSLLRLILLSKRRRR